jgi:hypothetical protein
MRRIEIYIIILLLVISAALFSYLYLFNIYEVIYTVNPESLFADNQSVVTITAEPINSFGWKVPFRNVPAHFQIKEGNDLINIISEDEKKGILKLRAKDKIGTVLVYIRTKFALLPSSVEIRIYPNLAFINQDIKLFF